jgi:hypothetical protein
LSNLAKEVNCAGQSVEAFARSYVQQILPAGYRLKGENYALDNLCNSIGPVVIRHGQFLYDGWVYSPPVVGSFGGPFDSGHHRPARGFITALKSKFNL